MEVGAVAAPGRKRRRRRRRRRRLPRGPGVGEPAAVGGKGLRPLGTGLDVGEEAEGKPARAVAVAGSRREREAAAAGAVGPGDRGQRRAAEP